MLQVYLYLRQKKKIALLTQKKKKYPFPKLIFTTHIELHPTKMDFAFLHIFCNR